MADLKLLWGLKPNIIVHVGAHLAEEYPAYRKHGWGEHRTLWIEGDEQLLPELTRVISASPNHNALRAIVWDQPGITKTFFRASSTQSSSLLELDKHSIYYPDITLVEEVLVETTTLEHVFVSESIVEVDLLNLDIQGAELAALKGLGRAIDFVAAIYSEVNTQSLYRGNSTFLELDSYLTTLGFSLVDWRLLKQGWGDALWLRSNDVPSVPSGRRIVRRIVSTARTLLSTPARALRKVKYCVANTLAAG